MKDEDLFRIDLNTLKVLKVLGHEKSTKKTAERLDIGQPAVSKALKKLREQFGDPLFNRTNKGIEPTPKCEAILGLLPKVMEQIGDLFEDQTIFEAKKYEGEITIHINPSLCHPLSIMLINTFNQAAQDASVIIEDWNENTDAQIKNGLIDLGINFFPLRTVPGLSHQIVCRPKFRFCCRQDHPLTRKQGITIEDIANSPLVLVSMANYTGSESITESYLKRHGYLPNVIFRSDKLDACADVLRITDAIAPVSEVIRPVVSGEGLALLELDGFDDIQNHSIAYYVSSQTEQSPYLSWLVATVGEQINALVKMYSDPNHQYLYDLLSDNPPPHNNDGNGVFNDR
ncbi:LysR family transcriptional regulator [Vibrio sp. ZSDE26]|uniref:LysR family transcriptional regulator n=1 Tax=Vibrio amylolyticus TaxID=2847292 RepID=A0A9X1XIN7_9VIBR|nr:LysR family transcriptional regulator [Vibrio amylolyticus]MCK6263506.1 LysR family transcriptional regulator [Vibrio amylolyticus]